MEHRSLAIKFSQLRLPRVPPNTDRIFRFRPAPPATAAVQVTAGVTVIDTSTVQLQTKLREDFTITNHFSWLKAPKTLLRHYA